MFHESNPPRWRWIDALFGLLGVALTLGAVVVVTNLMVPDRPREPQIHWIELRAAVPDAPTIRDAILPGQNKP